MESATIAPPPPAPGEEHVPDAVRPPPGNPRFPAFDGLRAMAALAVVGAHAAFVSGYVVLGHAGPWLTNLNMGVTVFFVISGFLLYRPFVAAGLEARPAPRPLRFYRRRLLRIVPAYWVALTIVGLIPGLAPHLFEHWPKYYFFLQIYSPSPDGIGPAWSLCVEMSFYLLLPFYAYLVARLLRGAAPRRRLRVELALLVVLAVLSFVDEQVWVHGSSSYFVGALPRFVLWFALGMGLAVVSAWAHATGARPRVLLWLGRHPGAPWLGALAAFLLLGALTQVPRDGILFSPAQQTLQYLFGALVALLLVMPAVFSPSHGREGVPGRILTTRVMAWTGLISYGIYLWHEPVISYAIREFWVGFGHPSTRLIEYLGIALGLTIPIAIASYVLVERPLLRFKEPRGSRRGPQSSVATPGLAPDPDPVPAAAEAAPGPTTRSTR